MRVAPCDGLIRRSVVKIDWFAIDWDFTGLAIPSVIASSKHDRHIPSGGRYPCIAGVLMKHVRMLKVIVKDKIVERVMRLSVIKFYIIRGSVASPAIIDYERTVFAGKINCRGHQTITCHMFI